MPTLYITHAACLDHRTPAGHPERPDRLRAIERALAADAFKPLVRVEAPAASLDTIALCHPMDYVTADPATPRRSRAWCRSTPTPRCRPAASRRRCARAGGAVHAVDEVMTGKADQRLRRRPPARPSRRDRAADGLLPVQQCRDRRAPRAAQARRRARRDHRFRRPSRQRLAGHLLVRPERDVFLDPPDAALSRHRRGLRERRARHHRQRAAAAGRRRQPVPRRRSRPASCRGCATSSPTWS